MRVLRWLVVLILSAGVPCRALPAGGGKSAYRISGVVLSSRDGSPVPFSRLDATLGNEQAPVPRGPGVRGGMRQGGRVARGWENEVVADEHGRFLMELPSAGSWQVTAGGRGFHRQHYDEHEGYFSGIVLTEAKPAVEVTFRVAPDATISGLVLDEAGEAVQGAQVWVEFSQTESEDLLRGERRQAGFSQTDDRGRYELTGLSPGSYVVRVQAHPWYAQGVALPRSNSRTDAALDVVYETVWYPGATDPRGAEVIRLAGGEERQADFHLAAIPAAHLRIDPLGVPAQMRDGDVRPRSQRSASLIRVSPEGGFSQTTNGDGADFGSLVPGVYRLEMRGDDGQVEGQVRHIRVLPGAAGVVDLSSATVLTQVKLLLDGVEEGQVGPINLIDTVTRQSVTAGGGNRGFGRGLRQRTGGEADGERKVRERVVYLAPGTYEVRLAARGPNFITGLEAMGAQVSGLSVTVGSTEATITVKLASGKGTVSGVAKMGANELQGAMVLLVPAMLGQPGNASGIECDQTNSDGSFRIEGVIPGKYILLAIDHGWDVNWHDAQTLAGYLSHGVPVEVGAGMRLVRTIEAVRP